MSASQTDGRGGWGLGGPYLVKRLDTMGVYELFSASPPEMRRNIINEKDVIKRVQITAHVLLSLLRRGKFVF